MSALILRQRRAGRHARGYSRPFIARLGSALLAMAAAALGIGW
jgi:hypothetical protein